MRLDGLLRQSTAEAITAASSTLGALLSVTERMTGIPVPPDVAETAKIAVRRLDEACAFLHNASFASALAHAKMAQELSDKAFFDKRMLAQGYFPQEHKAAVYFPLLGPVIMPLLLAVRREFRTR
jgi:phosphatidylinositol glycan class S